MLSTPTSYYDSGYDIGRWPASGLTALQTFYYDLDRKRYVEDVGYVGIDVPVWFYGHSSKKRHSERTVDVWAICGHLRGLVNNNVYRGIGGDSGGPMYSGDIAMASYHGSNCTGKDVFTLVSLYATASDYAVWER